MATWEIIAENQGDVIKLTQQKKDAIGCRSHEGQCEQITPQIHSKLLRTVGKQLCYPQLQRAMFDWALEFTPTSQRKCSWDPGTDSSLFFHTSPLHSHSDHHTISPSPSVLTASFFSNHLQKQNFFLFSWDECNKQFSHQKWRVRAPVIWQSQTSTRSAPQAWWTRW